MLTAFLLKSLYTRAHSFCYMAVIPDSPLIKPYLVLNSIRSRHRWLQIRIGPWAFRCMEGSSNFQVCAGCPRSSEGYLWPWCEEVGLSHWWQSHGTHATQIHMESCKTCLPILWIISSLKWFVLLIVWLVIISVHYFGWFVPRLYSNHEKIQGLEAFLSNSQQS